MNTFYLVRHAHAEWSPDENQHLSVRGKEDADRVADLLQQYPIKAIFSSPYRRAVETITPLARRLGLPVNLEPDLHERQLGNPVMDGFFEAVEATWHNPSYAHPGGESNISAQNRGLAVLHRLQKLYPADQIVLSTHGNLLALTMEYFNPAVDFTFWRALTMPDIYSLRYDQNNKSRINRLWQ